MKKNIKSKFTCVLLTVVLGMSFRVYGTTTIVNTGKSDVSINFELDGQEVPFVDPKDPTKPLDPPGSIFSKGLALVKVSNISFGTNKIKTSITEDLTYPAKEEMVYFQVSDLRKGTKDEWTVTASMSDFRKFQGDSTPIKQTKLTFSNGQTVTEENLPKPVGPVGGIILKAGEDSATFLEADGTSNDTIWINRWMKKSNDDLNINNNVTLTIPKETIIVRGNYTATITWSIVTGDV